MTDELKPCPFCGHTTIFISPHGTASCIDCGSEATIPMWNNRVADKALIAELEVMKKPIAAEYDISIMYNAAIDAVIEKLK
jgi:hypothetical protein